MSSCLWNLPYKCHVAILEVLSECLPLFDVFCKRSLNFIYRCLVSDNAVVRFVARHGVFHECSRVLGAIFSSAVIDIGYAHATLSTAHITSMPSTKRLLIDWIIVSNVVLI